MPLTNHKTEEEKVYSNQKTRGDMAGDIIQKKKRIILLTMDRCMTKFIYEHNIVLEVEANLIVD